MLSFSVVTCAFALVYDLLEHYPMKNINAGLLSIAFLALAAPTFGAVTNGSFETSDFTGWSTFNITSVGSAFGGADVAPTNGIYEAYILAQSGDPENAEGLGDFLGISYASLVAIKSGFTTFTEGSAIKQTFFGNVGDVISFDTNFVTDESNPSPYDFSFYTLNGNPVSVGDTYTTVMVHTDSGPLMSTGGWVNTSITLPATGTYTLGFGVLQASDIAFSSGLLIDNVQGGGSVPDGGSTLVLLGGSLAIVGSLMRRLRK
jgi:hypothetical protein